jgi:hypothetical protein
VARAERDVAAPVLQQPRDAPVQPTAALVGDRLQHHGDEAALCEVAAIAIADDHARGDQSVQRAKDAR